MYCIVVSNFAIFFTGTTAIETSVTAETVREVEPDISPEAAVIVVDPGPTAVARPFDPSALLMVAVAISEELQMTEAVMS